MVACSAIVGPKRGETGRFRVKQKGKRGCAYRSIVPLVEGREPKSCTEKGKECDDLIARWRVTLLQEKAKEERDKIRKTIIITVKCIVVSE